MIRSLVFIAALASHAAAAPRPVISPLSHAGGITVLVDGEKIAFRDGQPQSVAGRTLVPMRAIFEALGAEVEWNKELRKITARRDNNVIELTINEKIGKKNGAEISMDVAPTIRQRSTLVPLRFVAESLDATVDYDQASNTIRITTGTAPGGSGTTGGSLGN